MSRLEFTEAIAASRVAAFESSTELTLFGSETFSRCLIAETAKVQSWVVSRLSRDRHALRSAVSNRDTLEAEGSSIESSQADLARSEEHTSELQSLTNLVCRLLLEKKKSYSHTHPSALL